MRLAIDRQTSDGTIINRSGIGPTDFGDIDIWAGRHHRHRPDAHPRKPMFVTNVTKQKYYAFAPGLATGTGFETAVLDEPRMYGARLRYRF